MSMLKQTLRLVSGARHISQSAVKRSENVPEGYRKIKLLQAQFQKHDGLPVHLKGGATDKVLFGTTVVLCFVGLGMIGQMIFELANPPKLD